MTLALVQATVAILLTLVGTWTGLLVSVAFLLPHSASRSEQLLAGEPWKCFWRGLGMAAILLIGLIASGAGAPPIKLFGMAILLFVGAVTAIGAAGTVQTIGKRGEPEGTVPSFAMLVRGSLVFSLALGFPLVGWFVFAPLALVTAAGAGIMALRPERHTLYTPPSNPGGGSEYDISNRAGIVS